MTSHTLIDPGLGPELRSAASRRSGPPILVAVDGDIGSAAAAIVAEEIADRDGSAIDYVNVQPAAGPEVRGFTISPDLLEENTHADLRRVREQVDRATKEEEWRLHVEFGAAAPAIGRIGDEVHAHLIVIGLGRYTPAERLLGRDVAARVLRHVSVPVLAVHRNAEHIPRCAVAAVDFSPASIAAVRAAVSLLERPATLHLVHVRPTAEERPDGWKQVEEAGIASMMEQIRKDIAGPDVEVFPHMVEGRVTAAVLEMAKAEQADLIACGAQGHDGLARMVLGSVPSQLLHAAECSVLVAPSTAPER